MEALRERINHDMVLFMGLNVADSAITYFVLNMGGIELNWYRYALEVMPVWAMLTMKMLLAAMVALLVWKWRAKLFRPLNIGMALIVAFNFSMVIML